jgi:phosphomannomutase
MKHFLFDIDGTLTPTREKIDKEFEKFFAGWVTYQKEHGNEVFLVTGSDQPKTIEQIGLSLYRHVSGVYQNSGNQLFIRSSLIKQSEWEMSAHLRLDALARLERSPWYGKASVNIEERIGSTNISSVGRTASKELRKKYYQWDCEEKERQSIIQHLSIRHPKLDFAIGGEISIDIYPKGKDKSQVLEDMLEKESTIFFGDRCNIGENDYTIHSKAARGHAVKSFKETERVIKTYC